MNTNGITAIRSFFLVIQVLAEHNNSKDFLESMYTTVAILSIELSATDEGIMYLLELIGGIQSTAVKSQVKLSKHNFSIPFWTRKYVCL